MSEVINLLFSQEFLIRALVVGVLISLCAALLGVSLVLKRFSMIGDGLSHVGFGAMAIASAANVAPLYFSLPVVIISAFLLLRMSEKGKIKGDAAIALISTGALALGVMVTSMTTGMNVDIYNYMFGSILTMSDRDVLISCILSVVVIVLFVIFYDEIFAVTFDESFAKATGTKTSFYNMIIAALTAVTIVIGMRMMGALLISSLIIFPTVTSMRLCKSFRKVIISSILVSVSCFVSGLIFSVEYEAPTGASVVCVNIFLLAFFSLLKLIKEKVGGKNSVFFKKVLVSVTVLLFVSIYLLAMFGGSVTYYEKADITVVTTGFAQYDFAKNIIGNKGEATMLLAPGEESHTFEPTPNDIMMIKECDVFVYGGGESENWVDSILASVESDIRIVKMMDVVELFEEEVVDGMQEDEQTHKHDHDSESSEEYDEHVWTSPLNAVKITQAISDAVIAADPDNRDYYSSNTDSYINELKELDKEFREVVSKKNYNYIVIGDRFPLRYLTEEYSIGYYSAFPGCSAQVEANPKTIAFLIDKVKIENIPVVFKVDLSKGSVAYSVSEATGAEVMTLYSCHIISSDDYENGETYISLMNRNLEGLKVALINK